jgi:RHS repeat-associated protein
MIMPGRNGTQGTGDDYRYGFQGQEDDSEIKGEGNSTNYKYRMHDPRIGRFFAIDPLADKYPHNSPYAFSENKVIAWGELEGLEAYYAANGTFIGQVGDDKTVRVINNANLEKGSQYVKWAIHQISINGKWIETNKAAAIESSYSLGVDDAEFIKAASVAIGESSVGYGVISKEEMNSIAYVYINKNKVAYALKKSGATKFRDTDANERNDNTAYMTAISATIDAYNGIDNSNGASAWDGADQGVISGTKELESGFTSHAYQIGWTIHSKHYDSWKNAIKSKGMNFRAKQHDAAEGAPKYLFNKGLYRYESTAQHGLSIFFKDRGTGAAAKTPVKD